MAEAAVRGKAVAGIEELVVALEVRRRGIIEFVELPAERVHRHEPEIPCHFRGGCSAFELAPGDDHPLHFHPMFWRQADVPDKQLMEIAVAAPERGTHVGHPIALAERQALQAMIHAREGLDDSPRLI